MRRLFPRPLLLIQRKNDGRLHVRRNGLAVLDGGLEFPLRDRLHGRCLKILVRRPKRLGVYRVAFFGHDEINDHLSRDVLFPHLDWVLRSNLEFRDGARRFGFVGGRRGIVGGRSGIFGSQNGTDESQGGDDGNTAGEGAHARVNGYMIRFRGRVSGSGLPITSHRSL
jgi:hypothetical protein